MNPLLNIKQASKLLNISIPTIYRMTSHREIVFIKLHGRVLFRESDLETWIQEHVVKPDK